MGKAVREAPLGCRDLPKWTCGQPSTSPFFRPVSHLHLYLHLFPPQSMRLLQPPCLRDDTLLSLSSTERSSAISFNSRGRQCSLILKLFHVPFSPRPHVRLFLPDLRRLDCADPATKHAHPPTSMLFLRPDRSLIPECYPYFAYEAMSSDFVISTWWLLSSVTPTKCHRKRPFTPTSWPHANSHVCHKGLGPMSSSPSVDAFP